MLLKPPPLRLTSLLVAQNNDSMLGAVLAGVHTPKIMMNSMLGAVLAGVAAGAPLVNRWHKQFIARVHPSGVADGQPLDSEP